MDAEKESQIGEKAGSVAGYTESLVDLETRVSYSGIQSTCGAEMTTAQKNAVRLRDCVNPADLTMLLSEVWSPKAGAAPPFSVDSGEGVVHDLDVSELFFSAKTLCKKLISFVGFPQTTSDARNAAIDVFTWFCTFVSSQAICKWALSLAIDEDPKVAVAGLRGLVILTKHEVYRTTFHQNEKLIHVLDQIDLEKEEGKQAAKLAFMMFQALILAEGKFEFHNSLLQRLEDLLHNPHLSPDDAKYWILNCFQAAVILSDRRVELMGQLSSKLKSLVLQDPAKQKLVEERANLYLSLVHHHDVGKGHLPIDSSLRNSKIVAELLKGLSLETKQKADILKLLIMIGKDNPSLICNGFDSNLPVIANILEEGIPEEKILILDLFEATSQAPEPKNKKPLHHEHGLRLIDLLLKDIDEQRLQILSFIWTHYQGTKDLFIEADVVPSMLSLYLKKQTEVTKELDSGVKRILCALLEDNKGASEIQDKVLEGLKEMLTSCDDDRVEHSLQLVLGILAESTAGGRTLRVMHWLVDEGLEVIIKAISHQGEIVSDEIVHCGFRQTLEKLIAASTKSRTDGSFFLKKFVMIVKAADIWPSLNNAIQSHQWKQEFLATHDVEHLSFPSEVVFGITSMSVLGALVEANQQDFSEFLHFLLKVILELGLNRAAWKTIRISGISRVLAKLLCILMVPPEEATSNVFMHCVAAVIQIDKSTFANSVKQGGSQGYGNLWNLLIKSGRDVCSDDEARAALLSFLRQSPRG